MLDGHSFRQFYPSGVLQAFTEESSQPVKESGFQGAALGSTGGILSEFILHTRPNPSQFYLRPAAC